MFDTFPADEARKWTADHTPHVWLISACYLGFVLTAPGKIVMKHGLLPQWYYYNGLLQLCLLVAFVPHVTFSLTAGWRDSVCCNHSLYSGALSGTVMFLFVFSKLLDLAETVLIILEGRQPLLIHIFHHIITLLVTWHSYSHHHSLGSRASHGADNASREGLVWPAEARVKPWPSAKIGRTRCRAVDACGCVADAEVRLRPSSVVMRDAHTFEDIFGWFVFINLFSHVILYSYLSPKKFGIAPCWLFVAFTQVYQLVFCLIICFTAQNVIDEGGKCDVDPGRLSLDKFVAAVFFFIFADFYHVKYRKFRETHECALAQYLRSSPTHSIRRTTPRRSPRDFTIRPYSPTGITPSDPYITN
ncbi:hypothetical protein Y032_0481g2253 [Ancylostoma ceylanicum]|uniref:Elongation of very long chain fatty acids protein n=1 Tax=Ancylostoma ceylanicum TaxID=53326 RepID=A0A016WVZ0_9BILA|nr:hypothetical protein Y032_0481g2253 [Ancylostoma ceylanicum]